MALDAAFFFLAVGEDGLGEEARRVGGLEGFVSPRVRLSWAPRLGRFGGGECWTLSSLSEETTTGCFRTARGLPMPRRL